MDGFRKPRICFPYSLVPETQKGIVKSGTCGQFLKPRKSANLIHMALLPVRHPQRDFFVLDIADVVPKDDTASMEHPIFSPALTSPTCGSCAIRIVTGTCYILPWVKSAGLSAHSLCSTGSRTPTYAWNATLA